MLTFLQFNSFNYLGIYIAITISRINHNNYGLIFILTFYLNHVRLVVCLSISQGRINPWHAPSHVFHCFILLNVVDNPHSLSFVREFPM